MSFFNPQISMAQAVVDDQTGSAEDDEKKEKERDQQKSESNDFESDIKVDD
jgi:hypothetical protein